jgi:hypothetical protein
MLKDLARCFTNRSNPWHNDRPNVNFQRDLNLMIEADREYLDNPTLSRLCAMVAELIFRWERLTHESSRMRGVTSSGSVPTQGKHSKGQKSSEPERHRKDESKAGDKQRCHGCNRLGHDRDTCRMIDHLGFVTTGLWAGSATERVIRLWERDELRFSFHGLGELMARHGQLFWCGRLSILLPDHQLLPELIRFPEQLK